jgi:hypothetical protein
MRAFDAQTAGRRGSHRGGHLYIQANEIHNAITYYRRSHDGTIAEDKRIPAGGAGSGYSSPSANSPMKRYGSAATQLMSTPTFAPLAFGISIKTLGHVLRTLELRR